MKVKRDSLLLKIIFFNDIAIVITSLTIVSILTFFTFRVLDEKIPQETKEEVSTLKNGYELQVDLLEQKLLQILDAQKRVVKIANLEIETDISLNEWLKKEGYYGNYIERLSENAVQVMEPVNPYEVLATMLYFGLYESDEFGDEIVSVIGENGEVLGESFNPKISKDYYLKNSDYFNSRRVSDFEKYSFKYNEYVVNEGNNLVLRLGMTVGEGMFPNSKIRGIVVSKVLGEQFINFLKNTVHSKESSKIFLLTKQNYTFGQLDLKKDEKFISDKLYTKFLEKQPDFYFEDKNIEKEAYYIGYIPLLGENDTINGFLGVAVSKSELIGIKSFAFILIITGTFILILVSSTIFGALFQTLIAPLVELAQVSEKISEGNYDIKLKVRGSGEIRTLLKSYKNMLEKIKQSDEDLRKQNERLQNNIDRITTIEKLLLAIHSEDEFKKTIDIVLSAFTSDIGLSYGRAIFFRYDEFEEHLQAEMASVKKSLEIKGNLKETMKGFSFQKDSIYSILPLLKIPMHDNILSKSVLEKKIIYYNDRGYKYNLGNELLASLGINNFMILPLYSENKIYGCILIDNYFIDRKIDHQEVELLNLLILNLGIYFQNKNLVKEKIDTQKTVTIGKLAQQIVEDRKDYLDQFWDLIDYAKQGNNNLRDKVLALEDGIKRLNKSNLILFDFSDRKEYNFQKLDLNMVIRDVLDQLEEKLESRRINISIFSKYRGLVLGDKLEIQKVFRIIVENSVEAIEKEYGKINILLYRENEKIHVDIIDNGIGISEDQLQDIFDPFVSYKKGNSGLGLPIAHKVIKEHGGRIKIESKPGEGTEVKITLNAYKEEK